MGATTTPQPITPPQQKLLSMKEGSHKKTQRVKLAVLVEVEHRNLYLHFNTKILDIVKVKSIVDIGVV